MKSIKRRSAIALITLTLITLTGCETHELKDAGNDVVDVMRNGVDFVTETGLKTADAVKSSTEKED